MCVPFLFPQPPKPQAPPAPAPMPPPVPAPQTPPPVANPTASAPVIGGQNDINKQKAGAGRGALVIPFSTSNVSASGGAGLQIPGA